MTPRDVAKAAAEAGFRTMPLGAKLPLVAPGEFGKALPDAHWGPECFDEITRVGILCGPCPALEVWEGDEHLANEDEWLLCIDLDGDWRDVPTIRDFVLSLPYTLTTHGGNHLFFAVSPEHRNLLLQWTDVFGTKAEHGAALDLRWNGGYVAEKGPWTGSADDIATLPAIAIGTIVAARRASFKEVARVDARWNGVPVLANGTVDYQAHWGVTQEAMEAAAVRWLSVAPLSIAGQGGHNTFMYVCAALVEAWGFGEEDVVRLVEDHYNPRLLAIGTEPWEERDIVHKARDGEREGSRTHQFLELAAAAVPGIVRARERGEGGAAPAPDAPERPPEPAAPSGGVVGGGVMAPLGMKDGTDLELAHNGLPWILQKGNRYWLKPPGQDFYLDAIEPSELRVAATRYLYHVPGIMSDKGIAKTRLENYFIQHVKEVHRSYLVDGNTFDTTTGNLTLATLKWKHPPVFHEEVDLWLRAMFGADGYPLAEQWIASIGALDRPAPMLYMDSPPNTGKGLLMSGIAAVWGVPSPGSLEGAVKDFNPNFVDCPLVFADEAIPEGLTFAWLRESITKPAQYINEKNKAQYPIRGYARYALAANGAGGLRFVRKGTLTPDDVAAVCERLLYLKVRPEAKGVLEGILATVDDMNDQMAGTLIPEHAMWLVENVPLTPAGERMAARPRGGEGLLAVETSSRNEQALLVIQRAMAGEESPGGYQGDLPGHVRGVLVPSLEGELLVHAPSFKAALGGDKDASRLALDFFETYGRGVKQQRVGKVNLKVRVLDRAMVERDLELLE